MDSKSEDVSVAVVRETATHRNNTKEEKRAMRNKRKKKMRKRESKRKIGALKQELKEARSEIEKSKRRICTLRSMSRTFWERWRWELEKRKEAMMMNRRSGIHSQLQCTTHSMVHEIQVSMLSDPVVNGNVQEEYLGRGSFGVVKLQMYRGLYAAVKELNVRSVKEDVKNEAEFLALLCHPYLPYLFGVSTAAQPLRIIMQFHGFLEPYPYSLTLRQEIHQRKLQLNSDDWLVVCAQLLETVDYLHQSAKILHNDIKDDNIILGRSASSTELQPNFCTNYQVVLIDFGKATKATEGKRYHLLEHEKAEYKLRYAHLPLKLLKVTADRQHRVICIQ